MSAAKLVIGPDVKPGHCFYEEGVDGSLLRVHYRVSRVSARPGEYCLRHFTEASQADREKAEAVVRSMDLDRAFRYWAARDVVRRRRWSQDRRRWFEFVYMGTRVDDPLVQLELEMMIDTTSGVSV